MEFQIKKLTNNSSSKKYKNAVAGISADCFIDDTYFDYLANNKQDKKKRLQELYCDMFDVANAVGDCFGAFENNQLVGYVNILDYKKLQNDKVRYNQVFDGVEESDYANDIYAFLDKANQVRDAKYLLAICVAPEHQRKGVASQLVKFATEHYQSGSLFSDVDNEKSLAIYNRLGFEVNKISDKFYYVCKNLEKTQEIQNSKLSHLQVEMGENLLKPKKTVKPNLENTL